MNFSNQENGGACFHFIGLFCYKALTVKVEKNVQKMLFTNQR